MMIYPLILLLGMGVSSMFCSMPQVLGPALVQFWPTPTLSIGNNGVGFSGNGIPPPFVISLPQNWSPKWDGGAKQGLIAPGWLQVVVALSCLLVFLLQSLYE